MRIIGLTGGIGSGKSTVAKMFRELGVPVYDSDMEAKKLMNSSAAIKNAIVALLGEEAYSDDGLNRVYISNKVFNDSELLQQLNAIVHPEVRSHFLDWKNQQHSNYVVQETALIFENEAQNNYDAVVLVTAPEELRLQRVMLRDGVTEQQVRDRMGNQMEEGEKLKLTDFHIENINIEKTGQAVLQLHQKLDRLSVDSKF